MKKQKKKFDCLAETHPHLVKEWHYIKNAKVTPYDKDVTAGSHKKVYWKCPNGDDHIWKATIYHRANGTGCPICSGRKVVLSTCLATTCPDLAKEWHPAKNGDLTPYKVISGSHKEVYWKCYKGDDHEWKTRIVHRANGSGCPVCKNLKIVKSNCLATTHSHLAKEWHPSKNGDLTPNGVVAGSDRKVYWKCFNGDDHEWKAAICDRTKTNGTGCPFCVNSKVSLATCLATTDPDLAEEWHPSKNGNLTPYDITAGSGIKIYWKCYQRDDHEWKAAICDRKRGTGCPLCVDRLNSRGICKIEDWLKNNNILYERERSIAFFSNLCLKSKNASRLRFDFYIPSKKAFIEFDGRQHFEAIERWGGSKALEKNRINDDKKNNWVKENNYLLIRISFEEENIIEDILSRKLF